MTPAPDRCPACGQRLEPWMRAPSSEPSAPGLVPLARCPACGSARTLAPAPDEVHEIGTYRPVAPRAGRVVDALGRAFSAERVRILAAAVPAGARVLDVGAGRGRFLIAAVAAGFRAEGIEPSAQGHAAARSRGADVRHVAVEEAEFPPGSFDAVTLWHVLEHVEDPAATLERITGWLAPGGTLVLALPDLDSWQARLGGGRWFHLDVPRHRVHLTRRGARRLLAAHGYEVRSDRRLLLEHNLFGMWQTLANRLTRRPSYLFHLLKRNAPLRDADLLRTTAAVVTLPAAVALELAAELAGRGGTMVLLARRGREAPGRGE